MSALQVTWFFLLGILLAGYAVLDGFDLGMGFWYLLARGDGQRRMLLRSIGPVWDGNEVWLLAGAGVIFAAFPPVYALVLSALYIPAMALLAALIFRAVSIEFRSHAATAGGRRTWDVAFAVASILATFLFGVALGNMLQGLKLGANGLYAGTVWDLITSFTVVVGLFGAAMFATHGALWIAQKVEGPLAERARGWANMAAIAWLVFYAAIGYYNFRVVPWLVDNYLAMPVLFAIPALAVAAIVLVMILNRARKSAAALVTSGVAIVLATAGWGAAMFPNIVQADGAHEHSLTAANASSSPLTLKVMLIVALVGMPIVLGYTVYIYRQFRGRVKEESPADEAY